jgi:RimJ/RimL family protein N-acetyltransferase
MEIITERLLLREIGWNDLEDIHRLHSIPEVDEFNTLGIPKDLDETRELMRPDIETGKKEVQNRYTWRIVLAHTGDFIGLAGMTLSNDKYRLGEIYYKLLPDHWGKGYATEVARSLILTGFDKFHLHKVEAGVATDNERSIRVLEKVGMTREGLRRKILPIRGQWRDNYHYAIVEDDPRDY